MEKELTSYTLKSDSLYRYITSIRIFPSRKYEQFIKIHSKGDKVPTFKLFGFPISHRICEDNEYYIKIKGLDFYGTIFEILSDLRWNYSKNLFYKDYWCYYYGIVDIYYLGSKNADSYKFRNNEELENFVNELKEKCKEQDNILKIV